MVGALSSPFSGDAYAGRTEVVNLVGPDCSPGAGVSAATTLLNCSSDDRGILMPFFNLAAVRCDGLLLMY